MTIRFKGNMAKVVAKNVGDTSRIAIRKRITSSVLSGNFTIPALGGNKFFTVVNGKLTVSRIMGDGSYSNTPVGYLPNNPAGDDALNTLLDDNTSPIDVKTFSSGTKALILCALDSDALGSLSIVNLADNSLIKRIPVSTNIYNKMKVSPNGLWAVLYGTSASERYTYMLLNLTNYTIRVVRNYFNQLNDVTFSPDSSKVYAVGINGSTGYFTQYTISTGAYIDASANNHYNKCLVISPDGTKAYVGENASDGGAASVYNLSSSVPVLVTSPSEWINTGGFRVTNAAITPDGSKVIFTSTINSIVKVINTSNNSVSNIGTLPSNSNGYGPSSIKALSNTKVITGNYSANVSIIDLTNGATTNVVCGTTEGHIRNSIEVTPDGSRVLVANGTAGQVTSIDLATNQTTTLATRGTQVQVAIASNFKALSVGGAINLINLSNNSVISSNYKNIYIAGSEVSAGGTSAIVNGYYIKSNNTPVLTSTLPVPNRGFTRLTKDGKLIVASGGASSSTRNICYIIDAETRDLLTSFTMSAGNISYMLVTADSSKAVIGRSDGYAVVIDLVNRIMGTPIYAGGIAPTGLVVPLSSSNKAIMYSGSNFTLLNLSANTGVSTGYTSLQQNSVSMSPDGTRMLVSSTTSASPKLYNISTNTPSEINFLSSASMGYVRCTAFTNDGSKMIIASDSNDTWKGVFVFSTSSPYTLLAYRKNPYNTNPTSIRITPDGSKAIIGSNISEPQLILDLTTYRSTYEVFEGLGTVSQCGVTPDGTKAIVLCGNGTASASIKVVDLNVGFNSADMRYGSVLTTISMTGTVFFKTLSVSPTGGHAIVILSMRNGSEATSNNLFVINLSSPYTTTTLSSGLAMYGEVIFSPDGSRAVAMHGQQPSLTTINLTGTPTIVTKSGFSSTTGYYGEFIDNDRFVYRYATGLGIFNFTNDQKTYIATSAGNSAKFVMNANKTKLVQMASNGSGIEVVDMTSPSYPITSYANIIGGTGFIFSGNRVRRIDTDRIIFMSNYGQLIFNVNDDSMFFLPPSSESYGSSYTTYASPNSDYIYFGLNNAGAFYKKTTNKFHVSWRYLSKASSNELFYGNLFSENNQFIGVSSDGLIFKVDLNHLPDYPGFNSMIPELF